MSLSISPVGAGITKRFFEAIDTLRAQKRIRGLQTFTREYGLNYWNVTTLKNNPETKILKPEMLNYLVIGYGISADWLLTGRGEMFTNLFKKTCP